MPQILNRRVKGDAIAEIEDGEGQIREYEGSNEGATVAPNIRSATRLKGLPQESGL